MSGYFMLLRRKCGVVTLILLLAFMVGWLTGDRVIDSILFARTAFAEEQWGTLTGQVLFEGKPPISDPGDESLVVDPTSKGVANVVIYLPHQPALVHPDLIRPQIPNGNDAEIKNEAEVSNEIKFEIKNNRFVPHVSLVQTGVNIRLVSHDQVAHVVQTFPHRNSVLMKMFPAGNIDGFQLPPQLMPEKIPFKVVDPIYSAMSAYWVVLDHPYAAVTDNDGKFQISQLPVGDHKFMIWHERCGYVMKNYQVKVKQGLNEMAPMAIEPSSLR